MIRFAQVTVTFGTGVPCGLFVPSLYVGACCLVLLWFWDVSTQQCILFTCCNFLCPCFSFTRLHPAWPSSGLGRGLGQGCCTSCVCSKHHAIALQLAVVAYEFGHELILWPDVSFSLFLCHYDKCKGSGWVLVWQFLWGRKRSIFLPHKNSTPRYHPMVFTPSKHHLNPSWSNDVFGAARGRNAAFETPKLRDRPRTPKRHLRNTERKEKDRMRRTRDRPHTLRSCKSELEQWRFWGRKRGKRCVRNP